MWTANEYVRNESVLNWVMRYQPFIRLLEENRATTVIDVGSGWTGLTWYWPHRVVQTDLKFPGTAPTQPRPGTPLYVTSSAESLPFADDSFDYALSSDMMEHLPMELRSASLRELTRVARRGVLIGYPSGPTAARVDRRIARVFKWRGQAQPDWLQEHLAQESYPDRRTVIDALPDDWRIAHEENNGNGILTTVVVLFETTRGLSRLARKAESLVLHWGMPTVASRGATIRKLYLLMPSASVHGSAPRSPQAR